MAAINLNNTDPRPLKIFFEDEAKFGRMNHVRKCWVGQRDRAVVKKQLIREYLYAFTTVCPETGETCSIISPYCNTDAMNALLVETHLEFPNYRILMIMDSAGWHTTKNLILPENISLLPLPAYSPQLNPTEHIWDYIREQKNFNNYTFNSLDDLDKHLGNVLSEICDEREIIKSMCEFEWIKRASC